MEMEMEMGKSWTFRIILKHARFIARTEAVSVCVCVCVSNNAPNYMCWNANMMVKMRFPNNDK